MREVHQKSHTVALKNVLCGLFFVSNGELDYLLTTFFGVFRLAGKILVQFISDMERVFLFQMSINIGGDLNATVTHRRIAFAGCGTAQCDSGVGIR